MSVPEPKSRILIVDDDVSVAESLGLIFEGRGYDVRRAYSAEDAIDLVAEWQPDAAILDVMLPRMSGIELARAMGTAIPTCPVLLVSGHPGVEDMLTEAEAAGETYEILAKPLHPSLLLDRVAGLVSDMPVRAKA
jgi:two-component system response regulator MprA